MAWAAETLRLCSRDPAARGLASDCFCVYERRFPILFALGEAA
jgi:hypothetical protein